MKQNLITILTVSVLVICFVLFFFTGYAVRGWVDQGRPVAAPQPQPTQPNQPAQQPTSTQQQLGGLVVPNVTADDDPARGAQNAALTFIEFSDFQCPFSKRYFDETLTTLLVYYGNKMRYVYRDFPLTSIHNKAQKAAEAAQCAFEQGKFWEYHDLLFKNQGKLELADLKAYALSLGLDEGKFNLCLESGKYAAEVQKDIQDGQTYGVKGTPTFFINGRMVVGAQPYATFKTVLDEELAKVAAR